MSNFVYFISTSYLKDNTPLNENLDDKILKSSIKEAQEIYIRDIIGSGIYDELQTQAYGGTLTADNTTFLGLLYCSLFEVLYAWWSQCFL
jgi:hypothetical protein